MRARNWRKIKERAIAKELIAFRGGSGIREKDRPTGPRGELEIGQMDQMRSIWDFVNI